MTGVYVSIVVVAADCTASVGVAARAEVVVPAMVSAVPCKTAAVVAPAVVMPAVVTPAVIPGAVVGTPGAVAVPAGAVPGIVPGPAAVPERIAPAPSVP